MAKTFQHRLNTIRREFYRRWQPEYTGTNAQFKQAACWLMKQTGIQFKPDIWQNTLVNNWAIIKTWLINWEGELSNN